MSICMSMAICIRATLIPPRSANPLIPIGMIIRKQGILILIGRTCITGMSIDLPARGVTSDRTFALWILADQFREGFLGDMGLYRLLAGHPVDFDLHDINLVDPVVAISE